MMNFTFMLIQYEYYSLVFYARLSNPQKVLIKKKQAVIWVTVLENIGDSLIVIHKSISLETGRISESITMRWRLFLLWL